MAKQSQADGWPLPTLPQNVPDTFEDRHICLVGALQPLAIDAWISRPIVLDGAMGAAYDLVEHVLPTDNERRFAGKQIMLGLLAPLRDLKITVDDMDAVMGAGPECLERFDLSPDEVDRYTSWREEAIGLLVDQAKGEGDTLKKWVWNPPMVTAMYAFHVTSWLRLCSIGKLPPLSVPHLPSAWTGA